jgi:carotenoid cleavage dioxygenase
VRIGPNPIAAPDPATYHWFSGTGMVHGVRVRDGRAEWYRNRWVRSASVARELGEPVRSGPVNAGFDVSPNTNVLQHAGRTLALVEAGPRPYELTDELDTLGPYDFGGTLRTGYTAHPHLDPVNGELHAISYSWQRPDELVHTVAGGDGQVHATTELAVPGSPMVHDFALTGRYVVVLDLPVTFDPRRAAALAPRALQPVVARLSRLRPPAPIARRIGRRASTSGLIPYSWNADHPARVGLVERSNPRAPIRWFDVGPCYVFHVLEAHDEGDHVVIHLVRHPRMFDRNHHGPDEGTSTLERWTVDPRRGSVAEERLDDRDQEFPRIDDRRTAHGARFGYTVGASAPGRDGFDAVLRHDLVAGSTQVRSFGTRQPGELAFVPQSADADGHGHLIGYLYDPEADRSALVVLDAATLETVAEVRLPVRVPHGFHGDWLPAPR